MKISEMIEKKREYGYTYEMISRMAGVSVATVKKIFSGEVESPRYSTLQKLEQVFEKSSMAPYIREVAFSFDTDSTSEYAGMSYLELVRHPKNGSYNYDDYMEFPGDLRLELMDGWVYALAAPSFVHQQIQGEIYSQIRKHITDNGGKCVAGIAPTDIKLYDDDATVVQPDVYIVCDRDKISRRGINGAPDLVVEILSKSTEGYDMIGKFRHYLKSGVREIWYVDPREKNITCIDLTKSRTRFTCSIYGFRDKVPLAIYDGDFQVDFAEIDDYLKTLIYEF